MMFLFYYLVTVFLPFVLGERSSGCRSDGAPDELKNLPSEVSIIFDDREVHVSLPLRYHHAKPAPLILAFHDRDVPPEDMKRITKLSETLVNNNTIVVYPVARNNARWMTDEGSDFEPKEESWDSKGEDPTNDLFFTSRLLNHLQSRYCISNRRIYAVGLGTGAGMVQATACQPQLSRKIAAFASVGGHFYQLKGGAYDFWEKCLIGRRPIPILDISGDKNENEHSPSKQLKANRYTSNDWVRQWVELNDCGNKKLSERSLNTTSMFELENGQLSKSLVFHGSVTRSAYRCGEWKDRDNSNLEFEETDQSRLSVVQYIIHGYGFGWPRFKAGILKEGGLNGKPTERFGTQMIDASPIVLNFFNLHRLPKAAVIQAQLRMLIMERGAVDRSDLKAAPDNIPKYDHREL